MAGTNTDSHSLEESVKQKLIVKCREAVEFAYNPYSGVRVGAALLTKSGVIYTGCNVENISFGATICAERTAIVKAVSEGHTEFLACAVTTDDFPSGDGFLPPCGICRQFLAEFGEDIIVLLVRNDDETVEMTIKELVPRIFTGKDKNCHLWLKK